ncbi:E3 ubiquitin-protein ligase [Aphelenchoides besseyi]|nr:E3 ubiquitin-protein ligase [Aphelenchoides besseyi]
MAEFAEESVEKLVPTFELIRAAGLIQSDQLAEFIKRCGRYEYRLQKRTKSVSDYNTYIQYLKDFLEYWQRQRALKKRFSKDRVRKNIQQKICWIYKVRSERFKKKEFYLEAARFNKSNELINSASESYNRLLQLALRKFPTDVLLWTTMLKTELAYVKYIRARREKLAAAETKTPKSEGVQETEKPKNKTAIDSEAEDAVLRMDVVRIVIEEAKTAIPSEKLEEEMSTFADRQFRNVKIHLDVNDVSALTVSGPVPNPNASSVPSSGRLRSRHIILVPLRRHFASRMYEVFRAVLNEAIRLQVTSLAMPPIGTGGFHLDRTMCANALSDALESINDFGQLNEISIIDTNRNMVEFFHQWMSQLVLRDQQQNPQHYSTFLQQPSAGTSQSQSQATGSQSSSVLNNVLSIQPPSLNVSPFSAYFTALSKQQIAELRAARLEEIEREKDQNKEQPLDVVEACSVCLMEMYEEDTTNYSENDDMTIVQLGACSHRFHRSCVITWFRNQPKCPFCQTTMSTIHGPQPRDGRMVSEICLRGHLGGYEDVRGFIKINYSFPNGTQTNKHLRPGVPYTGTHRECYLPNTDEGHMVLEMLQYGYPDPNYLNRVKAELAAVGITEDVDTNESMDDSFTDDDD